MTWTINDATDTTITFANAGEAAAFIRLRNGGDVSGRYVHTNDTAGNPTIGLSSQRRSASGAFMTAVPPTSLTWNTPVDGTFGNSQINMVRVDNVIQLSGEAGDVTLTNNGETFPFTLDGTTGEWMLPLANRDGRWYVDGHTRNTVTLFDALTSPTATDGWDIQSITATGTALASAANEFSLIAGTGVSVQSAANSYQLTFANNAQANGFATYIGLGTHVLGTGTDSVIISTGLTTTPNFQIVQMGTTAANVTATVAGAVVTLAVDAAHLALQFGSTTAEFSGQTVATLQYRGVALAAGVTSGVDTTNIENGVHFGEWTFTVPMVPASTTEWILAAPLAAGDVASLDVTLQSEEQARGLRIWLTTGPDEQSELWFVSSATSTHAIHHNGGSSAGNFFGVTQTGATLTLTPNGAPTLGLDNPVDAGEAVTATRGQPSFALLTSGTRGGVAFGASVDAATIEDQSFTVYAGEEPNIQLAVENARDEVTYTVTNQPATGGDPDFYFPDMYVNNDGVMRAVGWRITGLNTGTAFLSGNREWVQIEIPVVNSASYVWNPLMTQWMNLYQAQFDTHGSFTGALGIRFFNNGTQVFQFAGQTDVTYTGRNFNDGGIGTNLNGGGASNVTTGIPHTSVAGQAAMIPDGGIDFDEVQFIGFPDAQPRQNVPAGNDSRFRTQNAVDSETRTYTVTTSDGDSADITITILPRAANSWQIAEAYTANGTDLVFVDEAAARGFATFFGDGTVFTNGYLGATDTDVTTTSFGTAAGVSFTRNGRTIELAGSTNGTRNAPIGDRITGIDGSDAGGVSLGSPRAAASPTRNGVTWGDSITADLVTAVLSNLNRTLTLTFTRDPGAIAENADVYTGLPAGTITRDGFVVTVALTTAATANFDVTFAAGTTVTTTGYASTTEWQLSEPWPGAPNTFLFSGIQVRDINFATADQLRGMLAYFADFNVGGAHQIKRIAGPIENPNNGGYQVNDDTFLTIDTDAVTVRGRATRANVAAFPNTPTTGTVNITYALVGGASGSASGTTFVQSTAGVRNGITWGQSILATANITAAALSGIPSNLLTLTFNEDPGDPGTTSDVYTVPGGITLTANPGTQTGTTRTFTVAGVEGNFTISFAGGTEVTTTGFSGNESPVFTRAIVEIVDSGITASEINGLDIQFTASDPEGDPFSFSLASSSTGAPQLEVLHDGRVVAGDDYEPPVVTADTQYTYTVRATGPDDNFAETTLVLEVLEVNDGYSFTDDTTAVFYGNDACQLVEDIGEWANRFPDGTCIQWGSGVFATPVTVTTTVPCMISWASLKGGTRPSGLNRDTNVAYPVMDDGSGNFVPDHDNLDHDDGIFYVLAADSAAVNVRMAGVTGRVIFSDFDRFDAMNRPVDLRVAPALERDGNTDDRDYNLDEDSDDFGDGWYDDEYFIPQGVYVRPVIGTHGSTVHEFDFVVNPNALVTRAYEDHLFLRDGTATENTAVRRDSYVVTWAGPQALTGGDFTRSDFGTFDEETCDGEFGTFLGDSADSLDGGDITTAFTTTISDVLYSNSVGRGGEWLLEGTYKRLPVITSPSRSQYAQRLIDIFDDVGPRGRNDMASVGFRNPETTTGVGSFTASTRPSEAPSRDFNVLSTDYDAGEFDQDYLFFDAADYRFFDTRYTRLEYTHGSAISTLSVSGMETVSEDVATPSYGGIVFSDSESRGSSNTTFHSFRIRSGVSDMDAVQAVHDAYSEILNPEEPATVEISAITNNTFTLTPLTFGLDSTFYIEAISNNADDLERLNEILEDNTIEKRGALSDRQEAPIDPEDGAVDFDISDDLENNRLSAVFPWARDEVNFNLEYPLFAQGRGGNGQVAAGDVTYSNTDGTPYESYIERIELAISPEFETEMVTSLALWSDGFAREFTDQPRIHNRLEVRSAGTNNPGQAVNLRVIGGNVLPISEGYKTDLRVHGRFINLRITDSVTDPTQDPTNIDRDQFSDLDGTVYEGPELSNSYSPNTAWRLSGLQADTKKQGTR